MKQQADYGTPDAQSYAMRSKQARSSAIAFKIVDFKVENLAEYTRLAQNIGFPTLKAFLENECQKGLFALTLTQYENQKAGS